MSMKEVQVGRRHMTATAILKDNSISRIHESWVMEVILMAVTCKLTCYGVRTNKKTPCHQYVYSTY